MKIIECLNEAKKILMSSNDVEFEYDAKVLLEAILCVDRAKLLTMYNSEILKTDYRKYMKLIKARTTHKPIAYILGYRYFMDYKFFVKKGILIPRDDTEVLVRVATTFAEENQIIEPKVIDVCTGSGCVGISIAKEIKNSKVFCIDISSKAINMSKKNVKLNNVSDRVKIIKSNLFNSLKNKKNYDMYDMIVSNPPYIKTDIIKTLDKDVKEFEPKIALDGGKDGLIFYKRIINEGKLFLKNGGVLIFEIDYTYIDEIAKLFKENNYENIKVFKDINDKDRVMMAQIKKYDKNDK